MSRYMYEGEGGEGMNKEMGNPSTGSLNPVD